MCPCAKSSGSARCPCEEWSPTAGVSDGARVTVYDRPREAVHWYSLLQTLNVAEPLLCVTLELSGPRLLLLLGTAAAAAATLLQLLWLLVRLLSFLDRRPQQLPQVLLQLELSRSEFGMMALVLLEMTQHGQR